ncbi:peptidoglycan-binding protein LysM [Enterococcus sp. AZ109]|uniref:peptidoglycan-binding protein LysM n=1 Tax=Enterococcus sp. AZ109 TaxID=2774634 RepID=UPI003F224B76
MKKLVMGMWALLLCFALTACGKPITTSDLKAHDWIMETQEQDEDVTFVASFTDSEMILAFDTSNMLSTASNEWEKLGEDMAKQMIDDMTFHVSYQLEDETIHLKNDELELDNDYRVRADGENLIFTPEEPQETETITLLPQEKQED